MEFNRVQDPRAAELRIGFHQGDGSWSYVGRDAIDYASDPRERTMNFGWDLTTAHGRDTALHEIGHALGFPHEQQNPNAGIVWNEQAVIDDLSGSPNFWNKAQIRHNILRKLNADAYEGSAWDRDSIMHYQFKAGLIVKPEGFRNQALIPAPGLSATDIAETQKFYPPQEAELAELRPFEAHQIRIEPGEQVDYQIRPTYSREYTIQSFGQLDTVMALFEVIDGEARFYAGDDDSGSGLNAKLRARLFQGRNYILRTRIYYIQCGPDDVVSSPA